MDSNETLLATCGVSMMSLARWVPLLLKERQTDMKMNLNKTSVVFFIDDDIENFSSRFSFAYLKLNQGVTQPKKELLCTRILFC